VGSIFLVSAPSFSLFAWAHRLSTMAWPTSTTAAAAVSSATIVLPPSHGWQACWCRADWAARAGLAQEVWLGRPGSDKASSFNFAALGA